MAGLFAISIGSKKYKGDFLKDLYWGTFYHQHLGEEYCGLSTSNGIDPIEIRTHRGRFRPTFANDMKDLEGIYGIGYCGSAREPFKAQSKWGQFCLCFSGNIINSEELVEEFYDQNEIFAREGDDIEIIAKLVGKGKTFVDGIENVFRKAQGAYSLLVLTEIGIYGARSPSGHWPLLMGEKEGAVVLASESVGFNNLGFRISIDVVPGDIVLLQNGGVRLLSKQSSKELQYCSFVWVYTAFPNDIFEGISVDYARKELGACLARKDIASGFIPDRVAPVPDSGRFHAIGYHQECCRQNNAGKISKVPFYDEKLLKYPYAGRSFTPSKKSDRDKEAFVKIVPSGEKCEGEVLVVVDDSIVRATQTQTNLVPKLKTLGVKEIHLRIANPELRFHCPYGKTTQRGELLVSRMPKMEDRVKFLGVDSLVYNSIEDLVHAIGLPREQLCFECSLDEK